MIECVEKLRKLCQEYRDELITIRPFNILQMLEAIEAEIGDFDLSGYPEPFNTTDAMHMVLGTAADFFETPEDACDYMREETCKPRTVEDVLAEFGGVISHYDPAVTSYDEIKPILAKYADELRGMVKPILAKYADELREMSNSQ